MACPHSGSPCGGYLNDTGATGRRADKMVQADVSEAESMICALAAPVPAISRSSAHPSALRPAARIGHRSPMPAMRLEIRAWRGLSPRPSPPAADLFARAWQASCPNVAYRLALRNRRSAGLRSILAAFSHLPLGLLLALLWQRAKGEDVVLFPRPRPGGLNSVRLAPIWHRHLAGGSSLAFTPRPKRRG